MSLLDIKGLSLSIYGTSILQDVSLSLESGQTLGVIGESGSGKSMTAFSILQLLPRGAASSGSVELNGFDMLSASESELCAIRGDDVSIVFQEPMTALNPLKTIGDQVSEAILIHRRDVGKSEAIERARIVLDRCELPAERFPLSSYPHELSGGQRQRVVIAQAIALQPKLLIADEPTTALDVTTQAEILRLLKRLVDEDDMGLMLISHDLAVVADVADHIAIMKDGEVVETGAADTLFETMRHPYTKALYFASKHQPDKSASPDETPILSVRNVVRNYRLPRKSLFGSIEHFRAVDNVSFDVRRNECLGLVGESGCGKSTLTRAILGLEPLQGGEILLGGKSVFAGSKPDRALRRRMQVVFQDPYGSFNPRHRVDRLITEPFHLLDEQPSPEERTDKIAETLKEVGLRADDQFKYIHEFSGGQRQRLAIARALIIRPDLILLDEVVSALDVSIRAQILDLLAELAASHGLTYLFISHDLSVVQSISDRVMVMKAGKIVEQGLTSDVFHDPQHNYTKSLLAAAPKLPEISTANA
ncbi:MAG: dipeptide ABC transporter ATP-binding protein [Boseongicola sp.]|nr:MAG: dipeptide ABC transporter ATP-binding protein [Boseongicola sp.]